MNKFSISFPGAAFSSSVGQLLFALLVAVFTLNAQAHEVRPAFLKIIQNPDQLNTYRASFRQPQVDGRFLGLELGSNCAQTSLSASINDAALIELVQLDCGENAFEEIEIVGLDRTLIDTLVNISWADGTVTDRLITGQQTLISLASTAPTVPIYFSLGIEHLLLGYDHILFVLMLLYLVRNRLALIKVITTFTVAHSITLAISALNIIRVPQASVEAVIAGSIVLLAYEILRGNQSNEGYPVFIAFGFGLLHGLGFAGALADIGLPEQGQLMALLLFNLGIEAGQLFIVVLVLLMITAATRLLKGKQMSAAIQELFVVGGNAQIYNFYYLPVYLAGGMATYWFLERIAAILK